MPRPLGAIVAEQYGVGVDFFEDLQVAPRLDFKDGTALGVEPFDLLPGVGRGEILGALPIVQLTSHEGGTDCFGGAILFHGELYRRITL